MNSERTAEVASVIRNAADRLTASHGTGEAEAVDQIARCLRDFADSLEDEAANTLVDAVGRIARAKPSTFLAGSVMAGLALEQAGAGDDHAPAPDDGAGFLEEALSLFRDSLEGKAHGEIGETGQHPLPLALAAVSIAWLLARQAGEEAGGQPPPAEGTAAGAQPRAQPHREAAVAPGGLGYLMTLSDEEEENIEWGSKDVT